MSSYDATPEHELASRYLDGDATPEERAKVETTPELLALVASMRHVATLIGAVPTASAAIRDAAISSALAELDADSADGKVVSLADRRRWPAKVLSAAAAVLLLGVVGAAGMNYLRDSAESKTATRQEPKFESHTAEDAAGGVDPAAGEVLVAMTGPIAIDDPQDLLLLMPPEAPPADSDTSATGSTARTTAPATATDEGAERYHSLNVDALACMAADQVFLADIYFQGTLAIAVRDTVSGVTEAIDNTCTVLASVAP